MITSLFITTAFAIINPVLPSGTGTGAGEPIIGRVISAIVGFFMIAGAVAALIYISIGAIKWLTSSGDKNKLESAREQILQAFVGLLILASVWALIKLVGVFIGFDITNFTVPTL